MSSDFHLSKASSNLLSKLHPLHLSLSWAVWCFRSGAWCHDGHFGPGGLMLMLMLMLALMLKHFGPHCW